MKTIKLSSDSRRETVRTVVDGKHIVVEIFDRDAAAEDVRKAISRASNLGVECVLKEVKDSATLAAAACIAQGRPHIALLEDVHIEGFVREIFGNKIPPKKAAELFANVALALDDLHRSGLIHGSLSPNSIAVTDSDEPEVLLFDVGAPVECVEKIVFAAPEMTGRIQRRVDKRSDLYALGATLFGFLAGVAPFSPESDLTTVIHSVIAKPPPPLPAEVPAILTTIVLKLLEKDPDRRYQTAIAVHTDLLRFSRMENAMEFEPCVDTPDVLRPPRRLHGRERELSEFVSAVDEARKGEPAFVTISGSAGQGTTTLFKALCRRRGQCRSAIFGSGKFEQLAGENRPYGALCTALNESLEALRSEKGPRAPSKRKSFAEAIRPHRELLSRFLPALGSLFRGEQVDAPAFVDETGEGAHERIVTAFLALLRSIASPEKPVVLFLDGAQWADGATFQLISDLLLSEDGFERFWVISLSFRPEQIGLDHPLRTLIERMSTARHVQKRSIALGALSPNLVAGIVGEMLQEAPDSERIVELSEAIHQTAHTPFEVVQIMLHANRTGVLWFERKDFEWKWSSAGGGLVSTIGSDSSQIAKKRIELLPEETKAAISVASLIGFKFTSSVLSEVLEREEAAVIRDLVPAIDSSLVIADVHFKGLFCFAHDRIQREASLLVPPEKENEIHASIGRTSLKEWHETRRPSDLFEALSHFNRVSGIMGEDARIELADLNISGSKESRAIAAVADADRFCQIARGIVGEPKKSKFPHEIVFKMLLESGQVELHLGHPERARDFQQELFEISAVADERAIALATLSKSLSMQGDHSGSFDGSIRALAELGVHLDLTPDPSKLEGDAAEVDEWLRRHGPLCEKEEAAISSRTELIREVLGSMVQGLWNFRPELAPRVAVSGALSSIRSGDWPDPLAQVFFGHIFGVLSGKRKRSIEICRDAVERARNPRYRITFARVVHVFTLEPLLPFSEAWAWCREGMEVAARCGDTLGESWCAACSALRLFFSGKHLGDVWGIQRDLQRTCDKAGNQVTIDICRAVGSAVDWLVGTGRVSDPWLGDLVATSFSNNIALAEFLICQAFLRLVLNDSSRVLSILDKAQPLLPFVVGTTSQSFFHVFRLIALCDRATEGEFDDAACDQEMSIVENLAGDCPEKFQPWFLFAKAISSRSKHPEQVVSLLDEADESAEKFSTKNARVLIALELHRWWMKGSHRRVQAMAENAWQSLVEWGIGRRAAVSVMEASRAVAPEIVKEPSRSQLMDVECLTKISDALGGEIDSDRLMRTLVRVLQRNAGAQTAVFAVPNLSGDGLEVTTIAPNPSSKPRIVALPISMAVSAEDMSVMVEVASTHKAIIESTENSSRMCMAFVHPTGRLEGVLLLKHQSLSGCFAEERVRMLRTISVQATNALENSRLFKAVQEKNARLEEIVAKKVERLKEEVAERIRAGEAAKKSAEEFARLFENSVDVITFNEVTFSEGPERRVIDNRVIKANQSFKRMAAKLKRGIAETPVEVAIETFASLEGKTLRSIEGIAISDADTRWTLEQVERLMLGPDSCISVDRVYDNGLAIEGYIYKIDETHFVASLKDVTEQRDLETQFQRSQKLEGLFTMAGGVAHDFSNMLQIIFGNMQLAQEHLPVEHPARPLLREADSAAKNAARLSHQLLAFSGGTTTQRVVVDVNVIARDMEALTRRIVTSRVVFRNELFPSRVAVTADQTQLQQIIMLAPLAHSFFRHFSPNKN